MSKSKTRCGFALAGLTLALAACGATPPQAPIPEAMKLGVATSGISTACGESYQVTAFPGPHRADLITLEVTASAAARKLETVYQRDRNWIFQGETVGQIVKQSVSMLKACGLGQSAAALSPSPGR
jgi:hypothetical protein